MKTKFYVLTLTFVLIGCSKLNPIEKSLIAKPDEHWVYYNSNSSHFTHFKFNKDKLSHRYESNSNGEFQKYLAKNDTVEIPLKWSVTKDSIFSWGDFKYDVVSYTDNCIVLNYLIKTKPFSGYIFLVKQKDNEITIGPGAIEHKRSKHPEKYNLSK